MSSARSEILNLLSQHEDAFKKMGRAQTMLNLAKKHNNENETIKAEKEVEDANKSYSLIHKKIINAIELIQDDDVRDVLKCRYVYFMEFNEIAKKLNMSSSAVYRIHRKGLEQIKI